MAGSTLTAKQSQFVAEYLIDLNATQAAIRAGYSEKTAQQIGSENLLKPVIADAIQVAMNERSERTEITSDFVLFGIKSIIERCTSQQKVVDEEGQESIVGCFEPGHALKGYELLGKHLKLFTDKSEVSSTSNNTLTVIYDRDLDPKDAYQRLIHGKD